jgi:AAA15 family ATPase/GTPase
MIHSLTIANFLSFKDPVTFSFEATNDKHLEEYHVVEVAPGVRLNKLGIVYGANASGKSNLVHAFEFLRDFWLRITENKDKETNSVPFLLDAESRTKPSEFKLVFYVEGKKHTYSLSLDVKNVLRESLYFYPGSQPAEIFTRELMGTISKVKFNARLKLSVSAQDEINLKCLSNMSVFAAYNQVNLIVKELDDVLSWFKVKYLRPVFPVTEYLEKFTENLILKNSDFKTSVLKFLEQADYNIKDIEIQINEVPVNESFITEAVKDNLPEEEKSRLFRDKTIQITKAVFSHLVIDGNGLSDHFLLPESLESKGTLRTLGLAGVIHTAIKLDAFMAIDEMESSFHPKLIEFFIENFINESKKSQLLITTHYDGLLEEEDLIRKDTIWFVDKKKNGSTELYSLSDFNGTNRISSIRRAYKYGKFGAVPNI